MSQSLFCPKPHILSLVLLVAVAFLALAVGCDSSVGVHEHPEEVTSMERIADGGSDAGILEAASAPLRPESVDGGGDKADPIEWKAEQVAVGACLRHVLIAGRPHCVRDHQIQGARDGKVYAEFPEGSTILDMAHSESHASFLVRSANQTTLYTSRDGGAPVALRSFNDGVLASPSGVRFVGQEQLFVGGGSGLRGRLLVSVGLSSVSEMPLQTELFPRWQTVTCADLGGQSYPCYGLDGQDRILSSRSGQIYQWSDVSASMAALRLRAPLALRIERGFEGDEGRRPLLVLDADGALAVRCGGRWRRERPRLDGRPVAIKDASWVTDQRGRSWLFLLSYDGALMVRTAEGEEEVLPSGVKARLLRLSPWPGKRLASHGEDGSWALDMTAAPRRTPWSCL